MFCGIGTCRFLLAWFCWYSSCLTNGFFFFGGGRRDDPQSKERLVEKLSKYQARHGDQPKMQPPVSWVFDVVRGSLIARTAEQIMDLMETLRAREAVELMKARGEFFVIEDGLSRLSIRLGCYCLLLGEGAPLPAYGLWCS